jgi:phage recombination protein Bet
MSTAELVEKPSSQELTVTYTPLGATETVTLKYGMTRKYFCRPTKRGVAPPEVEVVKFIMLCKARGLDPWVGDAWLLGYDGQNGPEFSLITAHQAILKRAELSPEFNGMESGVIVKSGDVITQREGDIVFDGESLLGGWAKVYRRDRQKVFFDALKFSVYDKGFSRWKADPAGMIVKCAEASALRKAFPSQTGGMYTKEEMEFSSNSKTIDAPNIPTGLTELAGQAKVAMGLTDKSNSEVHQGEHIEDENQDSEEKPMTMEDIQDRFNECTSLGAVNGIYQELYDTISEDDKTAFADMAGEARKRAQKK